MSIFFKACHKIDKEKPSALEMVFFLGRGQNLEFLFGIWSRHGVFRD